MTERKEKSCIPAALAEASSDPMQPHQLSVNEVENRSRRRLRRRNIQVNAALTATDPASPPCQKSFARLCHTRLMRFPLVSVPDRSGRQSADFVMFGLQFLGGI